MSGLFESSDYEFAKQEMTGQLSVLKPNSRTAHTIGVQAKLCRLVKRVCCCYAPLRIPYQDEARIPWTRLSRCRGRTVDYRIDIRGGQIIGQYGLVRQKGSLDGGLDVGVDACENVIDGR